MKSHKFAFTLAELMIVLSVIGILSAILLPVAFQSTPDKDILKFKKANNTLATAVREMISSDKYYKYGSLAYPAVDTNEQNSGSLSKYLGWYRGFSFGSLGVNSSPNYFCKSFGDIVSAKDVSCDIGQNTVSHLMYVIRVATQIVDNNIGLAKNALDMNCTKMNDDAFDGSIPEEQKGIDAITIAGNVLFYDIGMTLGHGAIETTDECDSTTSAIATDVRGKMVCWDKNGNNPYYETFCMDIDGFDGPIKPFGFGIRSDGKILTGARADWWLKRDITKKETDCCPAELKNVTLYGGTYDFCDDNVSVCAE